MADVNLADSAHGRDLIVIAKRYSGHCDFIGTRAMLDAEGLAPPDGEWPEGYADARWQDERYDYWLRRQRPEGAKGPRRAFADCDWWCMRVELTEQPSWQELLLRRKEEELAEIRYRQSYEGRVASNASWDRYWKAQSDNRFQAFLAQFPGLLPKPRGRKRKNTEAQE